MGLPRQDNEHQTRGHGRACAARARLAAALQLEQCQMRRCTGRRFDLTCRRTGRQFDLTCWDTGRGGARGRRAGSGLHSRTELSNLKKHHANVSHP